MALWGVGSLAESWEAPDDTTIIFHIRQGVHWHDEEPVNGRELTAQDVEYNFHRYLGLGSGFTEGSPFIAQWEALDDVGIESITATDKYTVVFKLARSSLDALKVILFTYSAVINAPEVIEEYMTDEEPHVHIPDYRALVGTGPLMLVQSIEETSMTWTKNPNYWGYDEKYPENRLPYVDELRALVIPEESTRLAAMRSGKLDHMGYIVGGTISSEVADGLRRTNPELRLDKSSGGSMSSAFFNTRIPPTNDIRVRHAMQMALDLETINDTYYKGLADWVVTLIGLQSPILVGGAVIIENIFNLPGVGRLFLIALQNRDYPMVSGVNLFLSTVVMLNILLIDLIYPYVDPRVRYR